MRWFPAYCHNMDVTGKAPKVRTLIEAQVVVDTLWDMVQRLSQQANKLMFDSKELHKLQEKNKTNSKNSSLPPSRDKVSKNKSNAKRNEQRKKNRKKQGGQPGHQKHERTLLPQDKVDHTVNCIPSNVCSCGGEVTVDFNINRRHQQYEFPVIKPIVTEYKIYSGSCDQCNKTQRGSLPCGVSWSMLGPRATAMTAHLSGTYRISKKNIVNLYQDVFGFSISSGMVCKAEKTVSQALETPVDEAKQFIQSSDNVGVNADETGFKEKGKTMWAWIAISRLVCVFMIRKGRTKKVAQELLGEEFKGILCSDRYSSYNWIPNEQRQICWAHLERDFRKISERTGTSAIIGAELLECTNTLFHHWHKFKEGRINRQTLKRNTKPIRLNIENLLRRGTRSKNKKTAGTCRHILSFGTALWRFIEVENIEPTNNLSEQKIRTLVIWQKTNFGTQSQAGSLYMERIMSVVATCRLQNRNILEYLTDAVKSYVGKYAPPSLLPSFSENDTKVISLAA